MKSLLNMSEHGNLILRIIYQFNVTELANRTQSGICLLKHSRLSM